MQIRIYVGSVFLRAFINISLKKEKEEKIFGVIHLLEISLFEEIRKSSDV